MRPTRCLARAVEVDLRDPFEGCVPPRGGRPHRPQLAWTLGWGLGFGGLLTRAAGRCFGLTSRRLSAFGHGVESGAWKPLPGRSQLSPSRAILRHHALPCSTARALPDQQGTHEVAALAREREFPFSPPRRVSSHVPQLPPPPRRRRRRRMVVAVVVSHWFHSHYFPSCRPSVETSLPTQTPRLRATSACR